MKGEKLFWISFSDIMLSMFFVILIIFGVVTVLYQLEVFKTNALTEEVSHLTKERNRLQAELSNAKLINEESRDLQAKLKRALVLEEERKEIEAIQSALSSLDNQYFQFDEINKRYRLNVDFQFGSNDADIYNNSDEVLKDVRLAGWLLRSRLDEILGKDKSVNLLLIIEGNAARSCQDWEKMVGCNWLNIPDAGYELSYRRALALYNYWKENNVDFRELSNTFDNRLEVIVAGSGHFGLSRESNETLNRRFTLQVTSKWSLEAND